MPDKKGNLYLFEAIELRNEYDRHIKLIGKLIEGKEAKSERFFGNREEEKEPVTDFKQKDMEEALKKLQTKRVKLNQAIQVANFKYKISYNGEEISLAEALEIRKNLLADLDAQSEKVTNSAYKRVIHKEERDIVHEPKQLFNESYNDYQKSLQLLRNVIDQIHIANHGSIVNYKDEK